MKHQKLRLNYAHPFVVTALSVLICFESEYRDT